MKISEVIEEHSFIAQHLCSNKENLLHINAGDKTPKGDTEYLSSRQVYPGKLKYGINHFSSAESFYLVYPEGKDNPFFKIFIYPVQNMAGISNFWVFNKKYYKKVRRIYQQLVPKFKKQPEKKKVDIVVPDEIQSIVDEYIVPFFEAKEVFYNYGLPLSIGMILHGPPGTGKTSFANSLGTFMKRKYNFPYYEMSGDNIARGNFPNESCTVLFDDVDKSFFNRNTGGEYASKLLRFLDGADKNRCQIRLFTTNESVDNIENAFLRPGRIDKKIYFGIPDYSCVKKYYHNMAREVKSIIKEAEWCLQMEGFTYAQMTPVYAYILRNILISKKKVSVKDAIDFCELKKENFNQETEDVM